MTQGASPGLERRRPEGLATPARVTVVGAGIAGAAVAAALARRGVGVDVLDPHGAAAGTSGLRVAAWQPVLAAQATPHQRLLAAGARAAAAHLATAGRDVPHARCGIVRRVDGEDDAGFARLLRTAADAGVDVRPLTAAAARARTGVPVGHGGRLVALPDAGWVDLAAWTRSLLRAAAIRCVHGPDALTAADHAVRTACPGRPVVLAASHATRRWLPWLPLHASRGQLTAVRAGAEASPRCLLGARGTVFPAVRGHTWIGSTHARGHDAHPRAADDDANLERLGAAFPELGARLGRAPRGPAWTGVRATTPDRLPLVGPVPDAADTTRRFRALLAGARIPHPPATAWHPGLWLCTGMGARGATLAVLMGELLAARICGATGDDLLPADLQAAVAPLRFVLRAARRSSPVPDA